ncbi:MAG: tyrosine-type recombinase/integrase [Hyphomicrobiaceae bacterium]
MPKLDKAITDERARKLDKPGDYICGTTPGFFLRVFETGAKCWMARADLYVGGHYIRNVKKAVGRFPDMSSREARDAANAVLARIRAGDDPTKDRGPSGVPTFEAAWNEYIERCERLGRKAKTIKGYKGQKRYIPNDWFRRPLNAITEDEVLEVFKKLSKKTPPTANAVVVTIKSIFNHQRKLRPRLGLPNPALAVERHPKSEKDPDQLLTRAKLPGFLAQVDADTNPQRRLVNRLMFLTGLRVENASTILRERIDFEHHRITTPSTKAGRQFWLPMSDEIEAVVREALKHAKPGNPYLFPGRTKDSHITVSKIEGSEFTAHDWRHHFNTVASAHANPIIVSLLTDHTVSGVKGLYTHPEIIFPEMLEAQRRISKALMALTKPALKVDAGAAFA